MTDFFISYTKTDLESAEEINEILKEAQYKTFIQCADILAGVNFMGKIKEGLESCDYCIAVLSPEYLGSKWATAEFETAYTISIKKKEGFLIPVKIKETEIEGLFRTINYIDLVNITERTQRKQILLEAIKKIKPPRPEDQIEVEIFNFPWSDHPKLETPYHLNTFTPDDEELFTKRNIHVDVVTKLYDKIVKDRSKLICLEGPSGCGKSSLVLSGLVPKLRKEGKWKFVYFEFTKDPYQELATGLTAISRNIPTLADKSDEEEVAIKYLANDLRENQNLLQNKLESINSDKETKLLLIADKIDGLYQPKFQEIRTKFLELISQSILNINSSSIALIAVIDKAAIQIDIDHKTYENTLGKTNRTVAIPKLNDKQLENLIKIPISEDKFKVESFDQKVINLIIKDLKKEKQGHNLVLLGAILNGIWEIKEKYQLSKITEREYDESGGVNNALNKLASEIYNAIPEEPIEERKKTERFFLRMIESINNETNKLVSRSILVRSQEYSDQIDKFRKILKISGELKEDKLIKVEFFHSKLAESWKDLLTWVRKEQAFDTAKTIELRAEKWWVVIKDSNWWTRIKNHFSFFLSVIKWSYKSENDVYKRYEYLFSNPDHVKDFLDWSIRWNWLFKAGSSAVVLLLVTTIDNIYSNWDLKDKNFSRGEKQLFSTNDSNKKRGIEYFLEEKYEEAEKQFDISRKHDSNDPEVLIYRNNSKVLKWKKDHKIEPILIAASVPKDGNEKVALEILRGVAQAQEKLIKDFEKNCIKKNNFSSCTSGIAGRTLQVMIINDKNEIKTATQVAQILIDDKEVIAVVGHNVSQVSSKAAIEYQKGGLVMISPTSFALDFPALDKLYQRSTTENYIYSATISAEDLVDKLYEHMKTVLPKKENHTLLFCFDDNAVDQKRFVERFQLKSVSSFDIKAGTKPDSPLNNYLPESISNFLMPKENSNQVNCDFSNKDLDIDRVLDIAEERFNEIDAIFVAPYVNHIGDSISLIKNIKSRAELKDKEIFASPTLYTNQTLLSGEENMVGITMPVSWLPGSNQGNSFDFENHAIMIWIDKNKSKVEENERIKLLNKAGVTWRSVGAYNATNAIIEGIDPSNVNSSELRKSLSQSLSSKVFKTGIPDSIEFYKSCETDNKKNEEACAIGKMKANNKPEIVQIERENPENLTGYKFEKLGETTK